MSENLEEYKQYLELEEKRPETVEKYLRDARTFLEYMGDRPISKEETIGYKEYLTARYAAASVNSMLAAMNCYLRFVGKTEARVKQLRVQRQIFCRKEKQLTQQEYKRLVRAAAGTRLNLVLQTICGTGIRVSELKYITVEAVEAGRATVSNKNKVRVIFIPAGIQQLLKKYIKKSGLTAGSVFVSKSGKPLHRSNIWRDMKSLCAKAGVSAEKVFPHNLRHLFARTFYSIEKDIVRLADLLGHSNIETTRIYTIESGEQHISRINRVQRCLAT